MFNAEKKAITSSTLQEEKEKKLRLYLHSNTIISVQDIHRSLGSRADSRSRKIGFPPRYLVLEPMFGVSSFPTSHKVIELQVEGRGHLVRLRAASSAFLVGVLGRLVGGYLPRLLLFFLLVVVLFLPGFIVLTLVAPGGRRQRRVRVKGSVRGSDLRHAAAPPWNKDGRLKSGI